MSMDSQDIQRTNEDRRAFLQTAGKIAVVVPPAMTVLLSTGMSSPAIAASGSTSGGSSSGDPDRGHGDDEHGHDHHHHDQDGDSDD
jgi:hypothetical protein